MVKSDRNNLIKGLIFISPWIIGFLVFMLYPIVMSFYYSLCDYSVLDKAVYIGAANYKDLLFNDEIFWKSLRVTFYFALISLPVGILLSVLVSLLLNSKVKSMPIFRVIYYLPSLVPMVALAVLWLSILNGDNGILNHILKFIGIKGKNWLADEAWALPALIFMGFWGIGGAMVTYLAGLQDVPTSLIEAAEIDGANAFQKIWHITLPMISPIIYFNMIMGVIGVLQTFGTAFIMTGGGPNRATEFYALYLFQLAFEDYRMGYASAMAWILFLMIVVLTLFAHKLSKRFVFYRGV